MTNEYVKKMLEAKLGKLKDEEVNFVVQQFERNSLQAHKCDRKMTTADALNEMSMNLDFYRRRCGGVGNGG